MAGSAGLPEPQPGWLGAEGLDHPEAVRLDRALVPDAGRSAVGLEDVRRRLGARSGGRRALVPQGGAASPAGRAGRGGAELAADPEPEAARVVLQSRSRDLR